MQILLIEDDAGDIRLMQEVLKRRQTPTQLHSVRDGAKAMRYLRQESGYENATRPHLILLDLNLPDRSGHSVLAEIKDDDDLKRIPVLVLSTSEAEGDIVQAYNLQANSYMTKPIDLPGFREVVRAIEDYWFKRAKLPPR